VSEFDVVVTKPVKFIDNFDMKLLVCDALRPGLVVSLSQVVGETVVQCHNCYSDDSNIIQIMKESTTFLEAKFIEYIGPVENSHFFAGTVVAYIPGFDVFESAAKPDEFIDDLELKSLLCNTLRPSLVVSLSQMVRETAVQCRCRYCNRNRLPDDNVKLRTKRDNGPLKNAGIIREAVVVYKLCFKEGCILLHLLDHIGHFGPATRTPRRCLISYLQSGGQVNHTGQSHNQTVPRIVLKELTSILIKQWPDINRPKVAGLIVSADWTPAICFLTTGFG
jgi:hypothetical protein